MALAGATVAGQVFTPTRVIGQFGQVYAQDPFWTPDPIGGTCRSGQTCPGDPQLLPGLLNAPNSVAIDGDGRVVVADTFNHRVQVFGPDGAHQLTIGGLGSLGIPAHEVGLIPGYPGNLMNSTTNEVELRFYYPMGVGVDAAGKILVADYFNHRIAIFHPDGRLFTVFGDYADTTSGPVDAALGSFAYPYRVALRGGTRLGDPMDSDGRLYVLDQGNNRVQVFDAQLRPLTAFGGTVTQALEGGRFLYPNDLAYDQRHDQVLVTEGNHNRIHVFTAEGAFTRAFGQGDLVVPLATAADPDGRIYVTDKLDRVRVFAQDDLAIQHLFDFGGHGTSPGQLNYAAGIAYGRYGRIVIADSDSHRIQIFEEERPEDTTPPVSTATLRLTPNAAGWVNAEQAVTFTATDAGAGVETIVVNYVSPDRSDVQVPSGTTFGFTEGVYVIEYYAIDRAGNREMPANRLDVRVDTTSPAITCAATTTVVWPPNHKMVPVSFIVQATDALSPSTAVVLTSAMSSEPDNGPNEGDQPHDLQGWLVGTADTSGFVRAERSGTGPGRIYSFEFEARDQAGNVASCGVDTVRVPHRPGESD
jgi:sugar lactone lactonase YvrE